LNRSNFRYKMVVAVRTDLRMGKGKTAAQVAHAAISTFEEARRKHQDWAEAWLNEGQSKIVVRVRSEKDLFTIRDEALDLDLPTASVQDKGLTQLPPNTATCVGIGPGPAELIDRITRDLRLL